VRDKVSTAAEAVAEIKDGALVALNVWGPGTPLHLLRALLESGVKDITVCTNNYVLRADVLRKEGVADPGIILSQTKKIIASFSGLNVGEASAADEIIKRIEEGTLEFESMSHGIFIERLQAGAMRLGGIYTPIGVGTVVEHGKEKRVINGVEYIFVEPIVPDVGLISAAKGDKLGNLVYHGTARAANPIIAMASRYTIAEVFEIVEPGELDPDSIVTPGIFVDRIVRIPDDSPTSKNRRIKQILLTIRYRQQQELVKAKAAQGGKA
jgi:3-oxoacid CoA-transferase A subunit